MTHRILWCSHTVNWLSGCTKVSPACTHCYAETMSARLARMPDAPERYRGKIVHPLDGSEPWRLGPIDEDTGRWTGRVLYDRDALFGAFDGLRQARKPRRVFVNSMSDTFHDDVPPESLVHLAREIRGRQSMLDLGANYHGIHQGPSHVIMLLTKRPANLLRWQRGHFPHGLPSWVWVGTTVEDQRRADERVPDLLRVLARGVRFLSVEPLLGPVALSPYWLPHVRQAWDEDGRQHTEQVDGIGWVIAGGESGPKARPTRLEWARDLRDQCGVAGVPFFFKQWGAWCPPSQMPDGTWGGLDASEAGAPATDHPRRVGKKAAGRLLDGVEWSEVPRG